MVDLTDPDPPYGRRLSRLEGQYLVRATRWRMYKRTRLMSRTLSQVMQSQMIGMQSMLERILQAVQQPPPMPMYNQSRDPNAPMMGPLPPMRAPDMYEPPSPHAGKVFPPLPGFAPPVRTPP